MKDRCTEGKSFIYIHIVQCSCYDEDKEEIKYFKTAGKTFRARKNLETLVKQQPMRSTVSMTWNGWIIFRIF